MKRKWLLVLSFAAMVCAAFWMRELASWRPKTVAKVALPPSQLRFSRDGRFLLVADAPTEGVGGVILNLENGGVVSKRRKDIRDFDKNYGLETFPRVSLDNATGQPIFSPALYRNVPLEPGIVFDDDSFMDLEERFSCFAWSKERGEIYGELNGKIHIWNWNGKFKRRVRYAESVSANAAFSPDGKWLISSQSDAANQESLNRYDVQSGKMMRLVASFDINSHLGFLPDGRYFWFLQGLPNQFQNLAVMDSRNWKFISQTSILGAKQAKWLPDNRIGIVQKNGFSWRLASGREIKQVPGPAAGISDWALSPDGNWIYSCETSGLIRKWRAR